MTRSRELLYSSRRVSNMVGVEVGVEVGVGLDGWITKRDGNKLLQLIADFPAISNCNCTNNFFANLNCTCSIFGNY